MKLDGSASFPIFSPDQLARHMRFTGSRGTLQDDVLPFVQKSRHVRRSKRRHQVLVPALTDLTGILFKTREGTNASLLEHQIQKCGERFRCPALVGVRCVNCVKDMSVLSIALEYLPNFLATSAGLRWSKRVGSCFDHATSFCVSRFSDAHMACAFRACPGRPKISSSGARPLVPTTSETRQGASSPGKTASEVLRTVQNLGCSDE